MVTCASASPFVRRIAAALFLARPALLVLGLVLGGGQVGAAPVLVKELFTGPSPTGSDAWPSNLVRLPPPSPQTNPPRGEALIFSACDLPHGCELWRWAPDEAQPPQLLADIRPGQNGSQTRQLTATPGGAAYFLADDGVHGVELWRTDGTSAGTALVADLVPDENPYQRPHAGLNTLSRVWPGADTRAFLEMQGVLWATDGSATQTHPIATLATQPPTAPLITDLQTASATRTYFIANAALWVTDGTSGGTYQVRQFTSAGGLAIIGGAAVFRANGGTGERLWRSDGTLPGTFSIASIRPTGAWQVYQGSTYLCAADTTGEKGLWRSNGTAAGTTRVAASVIRTCDSLTASGARLYASGLWASGDWQLWSTDGSNAGTLDLGGWPPMVGPGEPQPIRLGAPMALPDGVAVLASDGLWVRNDLTPFVRVTEGAQVAATVWPLGSSTPNQPAVVGGLVFFAASEPGSGVELWAGESSGGGLFAAIAADSNWRLGMAPPEAPHGLVAMNGLLHFLARDENADAPTLWRSDGTAAGTLSLREHFIDPQAGTAGFLSDPAVAFDRLYFFASNGAAMGSSAFECRLWRSDGTAAGTVPVDGVRNPGSTAACGRVITVGRTAFAMRDTSSGLVAIHRVLANGQTDLEVGSTLDPDYYGLSSGTLHPPVRIGRTLYYTIGNAIQKIEWGAPAPTLVYQGSNPRSLMGAGSLLYFIDETPATGTQLWASDGSAAGTRVVKVLQPQANGYPSTGATHWAAGGTLYFTLDAIGYRSDGTAAGTVEDNDARGFPPSVQGGRVLGPVLGATTGNEEWLWDVAAGTWQILGDIYPGVGDAYSCIWSDALNTCDLNHPLATQADIFFVANDGVHGEELWRRSGTGPAQRVSDIAPGPGGSLPLGLTQVGTKLYFTAEDGEKGRELYGLDIGHGPQALVDVSTSPGRVTVNQPATFVARVEGDMPTGQVRFDINGSSVLVDLDGGIAVHTTTFTSEGPLSFSATYLGDARHMPAASVPLAQEVARFDPQMGLVLPQSPKAGDVISVSATVAGASAGGSVQIMLSDPAGHVEVQLLPLANGSATLTVPWPWAGTVTVQAAYLGDPSHLPKQVSGTLQVGRATSTLSAAGLPATAHAGTPLSVTLSVTGVNPTGAGSLSLDGTELSLELLSNGQATLHFTPTAAGSHEVLLRYSGDDNNHGSTLTSTLLVTEAAAVPDADTPLPAWALALLTAGLLALRRRS